MYNGIGLSTARGSGTNGYVQRNFAQTKNRTAKSQQMSEKLLKQEERKSSNVTATRKPNGEILLHEKKRKVESKCFEYRVELEDEEMYTEEDIDEKVEKRREQLLKDLEKQIVEEKNNKDTHFLAEKKERESQKWKKAFKIGDDFVEGEAFDQHAQQLKKEQRRKEWEEREAKREKEYRGNSDRHRGGGHRNKRSHEMSDWEKRQQDKIDKRKSSRTGRSGRGRSRSSSSSSSSSSSYDSDSSSGYDSESDSSESDRSRGSRGRSKAKRNSSKKLRVSSK